MSLTERRALSDFWVNEVRETAYTNQTREFEHLQARHDEARKRWEGMRDQVDIVVFPCLSFDSTVPECFLRHLVQTGDIDQGGPHWVHDEWYCLSVCWLRHIDLTSG